MRQLLDHSKWNWIRKLGVFLTLGVILIAAPIVFLELSPETLRKRITDPVSYHIWKIQGFAYQLERGPLVKEYENARFILREHSKSKDEKWFTGKDGAVYHIDYARAEIIATKRRLHEFDKTNKPPPRFYTEFVIKHYWGKLSK